MAIAFGILILGFGVIVGQLARFRIKFASDIGVVNTASMDALSKVLTAVIMGDAVVEVFLADGDAADTAVIRRLLKRMRLPTEVYTSHGIDHTFPSSGRFLIHDTPPQTALFISRRDAGTPDVVLLLSRDGGESARVWRLLRDPAMVDSLYEWYAKVFKRRALSISDALDAQWLRRHVAASVQAFENGWGHVQRQAIICETTQAIQFEQRALSEGAQSIRAMDMTDICEWFNPDDVGACLRENIASAKRFGRDAVRRIFLVPSDDYLARNAEYRKRLVELLRIHHAEGLGCGVVYKSKLEPADKIDMVVYNDRIVWHETSPRSAARQDDGKGYFTTNKAVVQAHIAQFERLWQARDPKTPADEASHIIARWGHGA